MREDAVRSGVGVLLLPNVEIGLNTWAEGVGGSSAEGEGEGKRKGQVCPL